MITIYILKINSLHQPPSPEVIRKFRATVRPDAGQMRVFYGTAYDPHRQWAVEMTHGVNTHPSSSAKEVVNPDPKSLFTQRILDRLKVIFVSKVYTVCLDFKISS